MRREGEIGRKVRRLAGRKSQLVGGWMTRWVNR